MKHLNLNTFSVTLWFAGGVAAVGLILGQFSAISATVPVPVAIVQAVLVSALCGFIVDSLRFAGSNVSLKPFRSLKRKRVGKDMRRLLERSLGPVQQV